LIIFFGADHHGYVARIKAAAEALGFGKEKIDIIVMQLVAVWLGEKEKKQLMRMSKREGIYMRIDKLIEEVGLDVTRFFFLNRDSNSHLNFDLELAREQSQKNPIYYVQYAHARICSILEKSPSFAKASTGKKNLKLLNHPSELELIKQLIRFPEIIEDTAKDYQVQKLPQYAMDLATVFHKFYQECQVISEDKDLTSARLALISATQIVLKNILGLMGISVPEKM